MGKFASSQRIAVIGGGWAGMAAAVALQQQGHALHLWEASRTWGGRARALTLRGPQGQNWTVDNGQHILIGAYQDCLRLMRTVGVNAATALLRLPLDLRYADGTGLQLPDLSPPWDAVLGMARAKGWSWREKLALLRRASAWQRSQFQCTDNATVADVCQGLPARLMQDFVDPLCISALNLPASQASGRIFLRVLQDGLFSGKGGSNLLIPRTDLSALFPASAAQWLQNQGAQLHLGARVQQLAPQPDHHGWLVDGQPFDAVVLATPSVEAARLVQESRLAATAHWASTAQALPHTAIATVYAYSEQGLHGGKLLPAPMVALRSSAQAPAQFAFDKAQLGGPSGVLALVVSASHGDKDCLQAQVVAQARSQLGISDVQPLKTVIDKRATFACTPQVRRPDAQIAPRLWACGDYVDGPYPATLEGAVRSGLHVAHMLSQI
ncbi:hydroxysqualene dehydroxylase HpnE [Comamonas sp.]